MSNKFTVFIDDNRKYDIKIHKINCVWKKIYEEKHKPTKLTNWYNVCDIESAEEKAEKLSKADNNRPWRYARCGGNCFPRNSTK